MDIKKRIEFFIKLAQMCECGEPGFNKCECGAGLGSLKCICDKSCDNCGRKRFVDQDEERDKSLEMTKTLMENRQEKRQERYSKLIRTKYPKGSVKYDSLMENMVHKANKAIIRHQKISRDRLSKSEYIENVKEYATMIADGLLGFKDEYYNQFMIDLLQKVDKTM